MRIIFTNIYGTGEYETEDKYEDGPNRHEIDYMIK